MDIKQWNDFRNRLDREGGLESLLYDGPDKFPAPLVPHAEQAWKALNSLENQIVEIDEEFAHHGDGFVYPEGVTW